jgi:hypothetical protein
MSLANPRKQWLSALRLSVYPSTVPLSLGKLK